MEGVAAQSDSDPEHSWECKAGYYVCFKDCCQRINQFCNEYTKRCELCSTRSTYCGNDSLPVHCDAWCLQQKYSHNTAPTECVSPVYLWTTYILIFITALLGISIIFLINKRLKVCQTKKDPKCVDSDSSTDSLQLLQETQQKQCNEELVLIDHSDGGKHTTDRKEGMLTLIMQCPVTLRKRQCLAATSASHQETWSFTTSHQQPSTLTQYLSILDLLQLLMPTCTTISRLF
ncbi:uncharacterized protein LOC112573858 [Pomacea canaliculata]|uniref:uncharacterized protein LOC112573858 n=1 Tax=Pomacea canaliculata TaxID=400727 RepID=UPI000D73BE4A|nr:uncharacterized protein LOC112573858 [Pomacea canaliculata]